MRYRKILVALDRSPQAEAVFEQALELATKEEASLMVFHCMSLELPRSGLYGEIYGTALTDFSGELQAQWKQEKEEVNEWLTSYYQRATAYGVPTQWASKLGEAARTIRELADSWNADLVVLGRRGHRGLAEVVLGSVSNHVIHHAPCSVLVVQGINPTVDETPEAATQAKNE